MSLSAFDPTNDFESVDMEKDPDFLDIDNTSLTHRIGVMVLGHSKEDAPAPWQVYNSEVSVNDVKGEVSIRSKVPRHADVVGTHFLRLQLKESWNEETVHRILDILAEGMVTKQIGGTVVCQFPMRLNFLVLNKLEEYGRPKCRGIQRYNYSELTKYLTESELQELKVCTKNGKTIINNKYRPCKECDSDTDYLDIPLLFDFFSYGQDLPLTSLTYHEATFLIGIPDNTMITRLFYIIPEYEVCYMNNSDLQALYQQDIDCPIMQCYTTNITPDPLGNFHISNPYIRRCKFIFIEIVTRDGGENLPELVNLTLMVKDKEVVLDPSHFYVADYDKNIRLYAISPDCLSDMRGWIKVISEYAGTDYNKEDAGRYNMDKTECLRYPPVAVDNVTGSFTDLSPHVDIRVHFIAQNIYRYSSGMGGVMHAV